MTIIVFENVFDRAIYVNMLEMVINMNNKMQSSVGTQFNEHKRLIELAKNAENIDVNTYNMLDANEIDVLEHIEYQMKQYLKNS